MVQSNELVQVIIRDKNTSTCSLRLLLVAIQYCTVKCLKDHSVCMVLKLEPISIMRVCTIDLHFSEDFLVHARNICGWYIHTTESIWLQFLLAKLIAGTLRISRTTAIRWYVLRPLPVSLILYEAMNTACSTQSFLKFVQLLEGEMSAKWRNKL